MLWVKVDDAWKQGRTNFVKVDGVWKEIGTISVRRFKQENYDPNADPVDPWDPVYQNLPDEEATLYSAGTKQVGVSNYDEQNTYEVWQTGTRSTMLGTVDANGKYTVPSYNVPYEVRAKSTPSASKWLTTTFQFKPHEYTADTRREVCDRRGTCNGQVDCSCHPGYGVGCDSGCCPHCGCCVSLYCGKCWTEGSAPQLIQVSGYTNANSCWFRSPL
jgi:hypothetical protein